METSLPNKSLIKQTSNESRHLFEGNTQESIQNAASTEQLSTRNEYSKEEESSIIEKHLYDRSLTDNHSQEILIGKVNTSQFLTHEDFTRNQIQEEEVSENQESFQEEGQQKSQWMNNTEDSYEPNLSLGKKMTEDRVTRDLIVIQDKQKVTIQQSIKKGQKSAVRQPFPINKKTIDRIIYPVYTKKGIKYGKKRAGSQENIPTEEPKQEVQGKLLDGFLILYSCRVKLPHEAIKSKLTSQKIFEVIEEDLCYFQNLNNIDLADNKVKLEQLKNLKALTDINLQYNMISAIPPLHKEDFPKLENLNLSYNLISPTSIRSMFIIPRLKILDLSGNNLMTFPEDMNEFKVLEELNLSSNLFSSQSTLVNPALLIKALAQMPKLKRLNMSRNRFSYFHGEYLEKGEDFPCLQELDMSYNEAEIEDNFMPVSQLKNLQILIITGNPFAMTGKEDYEGLEAALQKNQSAIIINEEVTDSKAYLRKARAPKGSSFPYPNPIKLFSREVQKQIKGDYLNAEMMNQGVALQISEIRPNTNIEKEIFPSQLTRDAQEKEIFTPPNHQQMRFMGGDSKPSSQGTGDEKQFFITENIDQIQESRIIHEEKSQESEVEDKNINEYGEEEEPAEDENYDFGKAKMDFFKARAKEILTHDSEMEYEGNPLTLNNAYRNLKQQLRNPVVIHSGGETKPGYLKMTFSMCRNAVNGGEKFLEVSRLQQLTNSQKKSSSQFEVSAMLSGSKVIGQSRLPPLMRAGKDMIMEDSEMGKHSLTSKKSKKEEIIDRKIENLLESYKKQDEELLRKATQKNGSKKQELREKFGFSDEEEIEENFSKISMIENKNVPKVKNLKDMLYSH